MNTAVFFDLFVRSGFPKIDLSWILYLFPLAHRSFRIVVSGFVSLDLMLDITLLLFSTLILSGTDHKMTSRHLYFSPTHIIRSKKRRSLGAYLIPDNKECDEWHYLVGRYGPTHYPKLVYYRQSHFYLQICMFLLCNSNSFFHTILIHRSTTQPSLFKYRSKMELTNWLNHVI